MTDPQYDLFFSGQVLDGHFVDFVKADIQQLFKADQAYIEVLFSGKEQVIKRQVDKPTAIKFQQAFKKAGAKLVVKIHQASTAQATPSSPSSVKPVPSTSSAKPTEPVTQQPSSPVKPVVANKAGDFTLTTEVVAGESDDALIEHHQPPLNAPATLPNWDLSAAGSPLIEPKPFVAANIDTSDLSVAEVGENLAPPAFEAPEPVINTDSITLAPNQGNIESLADERTPVKVDISHLSVE